MAKLVLSFSEVYIGNDIIGIIIYLGKIGIIIYLDIIGITIYLGIIGIIIYLGMNIVTCLTTLLLAS